MLSTVILQGLAFFTGPIFSSVLGTNNYGIATTYFTWVQVASIVFSLQAAGALALARVNFPLEEQPKYQSSVISLASFAYFSFSLLTLFVLKFASRWIDVNFQMVITGLLHGWGLYCVGMLNGKFIYEFRADSNFKLSVATSVLTIGLSLCLIFVFPKEVNYWGRILGQALVYFLLGCGIYFSLYKSGRTFYNKTYWAFTLPLALPTVFHSLANVVLHQSDKVMLQSMVSNSAVGIYALSCTFSGVINTIWVAFNKSWVAFYYEYTRTGQIEKMKKHARNYIELFTILCMGFVLLAKEVFQLYADSSFWEGTDFIPLFSIGYYFIFLYSFPVNFEFYNKKTKTVATGTVSAAICNIVLNYLLIKKMGVLGAVLATMIAHGFQFLFHLVCARTIKEAQFPFKFREFIPGFLAVVAACALYVFAKEMWYVRWGVGFVLGVYLLLKIIQRKEIF